MTISSRTPEGQPGCCPLCNHAVCIEPSILIGDATCPHCGSLLWFLQTERAIKVFDQRRTTAQRKRALEIVASQLSVDPSRLWSDPQFLRSLDIESLDMVELVMELEEEFDISIADEDI